MKLLKYGGRLLTLFIILIWAIPTIGQSVDFTLRYNLLTAEYEVYGQSDFTDSNYFVGGGVQLSVVLPAEVADLGLNVTTVAGGIWFDNSQIYAPAADTQHDFHGIASNGSFIAWDAGVETLLFKFTIPGGNCVAGIRLFENGTDPQFDDPGMDGGDFNNYFASAFNFANIYNANYDNTGTHCNPPFVITNPLTVLQDNAGTVCFNAVEIDGDAMTVSVCTGSPNNGAATATINGSEVCVNYNPNAGYNGQDSVCIIVCDVTGLCDTSSVPITVIPPLPPSTTPLPPMVIETPITTMQDSSVSLCMPILDPNVGDTFTANLCSGSPNNGTATLTVDGNTLCIDYTPDLGYNGVDEICIITCDQTGLCDTAYIPVTVIPSIQPPVVPQPPIVIFPPIVGPQDSMITACGPINDPNIGDTFTATICGQPTNGTATVAVDNGSDQLCVTIDPDDNFVGDDTLCVIVCDQTGLCDTLLIPIVILPAYTTFNLKVLLQGALFGVTDGLMRDDLRANNLIPINQPYKNALSTRFTHVGAGGTETTNSTILSANVGLPDAIVDWVFVELRDAADATTITRTFSALVQRDGDVVDGLTGLPVRLAYIPSSLFLSIKHRNHLGTMTAAPIVVTNRQATVDFTTKVASELYNQPGYDGVEMATISGRKALWGGNSNADEKVKYDGIANDRIIITNELLNHSANISQTLNFDNAIDYYQSDINLDGKTKYDGANNDRVLIQNILLTYPLNISILNNFHVFFEQVPE